MNFRRQALIVCVSLLFTLPPATAVDVGGFADINTGQPGVTEVRYRTYFGSDPDPISNVSIPLGVPAVLDSDGDNVAGTTVTLIATGLGVQVNGTSIPIPATGLLGLNSDDAPIVFASPMFLLIDRSAESFATYGTSRLTIDIEDLNIHLGFHATPPSTFSTAQPDLITFNGTFVRSAGGHFSVIGSLMHDWPHIIGGEFGFEIGNAGNMVDVTLVEDTGPRLTYELVASGSHSRNATTEAFQLTLDYRARFDTPAIVSLSSQGETIAQLDVNKLPAQTTISVQSTKSENGPLNQTAVNLGVDSSSNHNIKFQIPAMKVNGTLTNLPPSYGVSYVTTNNQTADRISATYQTPLAGHPTGLNPHTELFVTVPVGGETWNITANDIPETTLAGSFTMTKNGPDTEPGKPARFQASLEASTPTTTNMAPQSIGQVRVDIRNETSGVSSWFKATKLQAAALSYDPYGAIELNQLSTDNGELTWNIPEITDGFVDMLGTSTVTGRAELQGNVSIELHTKPDATHQFATPINAAQVRINDLPFLCDWLTIELESLQDGFLQFNLHDTDNETDTAPTQTSDPPCADNQEDSDFDLSGQTRADIGLSLKFGGPYGGGFRLAGLENKLGITLNGDAMRAITHRVLFDVGIAPPVFHIYGRTETKATILPMPGAPGLTLSNYNLEIKPPLPRILDFWSDPTYPIGFYQGIASGTEFPGYGRVNYLHHDLIDPDDAMTIPFSSSIAPGLCPIGSCTLYNVFCEMWWEWDSRCPNDLYKTGQETACVEPHLVRSIGIGEEINITGPPVPGPLGPARVPIRFQNPLTFDITVDIAARMCALTLKESQMVGRTPPLTPPGTTPTNVQSSNESPLEYVDSNPIETHRFSLYHHYTDTKHNVCWGYKMARMSSQNAISNLWESGKIVPCDNPPCYSEDPIAYLLRTGAPLPPEPDCNPTVCHQDHGLLNTSINQHLEDCFDAIPCLGSPTNLTILDEECIPDPCILAGAGPECSDLCVFISMPPDCMHPCTFLNLGPDCADLCGPTNNAPECTDPCGATIGPLPYTSDDCDPWDCVGQGQIQVGLCQISPVAPPCDATNVGLAGCVPPPCGPGIPTSPCTPDPCPGGWISCITVPCPPLPNEACNLPMPCDSSLVLKANVSAQAFVLVGLDGCTIVLGCETGNWFDCIPDICPHIGGTGNVCLPNACYLFPQGLPCQISPCGGNLQDCAPGPCDLVNACPPNPPEPCEQVSLDASESCLEPPCNNGLYECLSEPCGILGLTFTGQYGGIVQLCPPAICPDGLIQCREDICDNQPLESCLLNPCPNGLAACLDAICPSQPATVSVLGGFMEYGCPPEFCPAGAGHCLVAVCPGIVPACPPPDPCTIIPAFGVIQTIPGEIVSNGCPPVLCSGTTMGCVTYLCPTGVQNCIPIPDPCNPEFWDTPPWELGILPDYADPCGPSTCLVGTNPQGCVETTCDWVRSHGGNDEDIPLDDQCEPVLPCNPLDLSSCQDECSPDLSAPCVVVVCVVDEAPNTAPTVECITGPPAPASNQEPTAVTQSYAQSGVSSPTSATSGDGSETHEEGAPRVSDAAGLAKTAEAPIENDTLASRLMRFLGALW